MKLQDYLTCIGVSLDNSRVPTANEPYDGERCFRFSFGAYGETRVDVFAVHIEDAFEIAVEWLDDNAPGYLVNLGEAEWEEAAKELGLPWAPADELDEDVAERIRAHAETDLTIIGHTTLKHGQYLCSWEWTCDELTT